MKMKGMVLGLALILAACVLMTVPALADPGPSPAATAAPALSAADQEFLASLAAPAPTLAAKRPIGTKSLCTATANCGGGTTVTCSSNASSTSCSAVDRNCPGTRGSVTCDGVKTKCPTPCPPPDCDALAAQCAD